MKGYKDLKLILSETFQLPVCDNSTFRVWTKMTTKFGKIMVMLTCGGMLGVATPADTFKLLIVHTNDMHSRFDQASKSSGVCSKEEADKNQCYGGFARVSTAVTLARERSSKAETKSLFLIAGDIYQGTNMYTFYKWPIVSRMTNMLKPDAMVREHFDFPIIGGISLWHTHFQFHAEHAFFLFATASRPTLGPTRSPTGTGNFFTRW